MNVRLLFSSSIFCFPRHIPFQSKISIVPSLEIFWHSIEKRSLNTKIDRKKIPPFSFYLHFTNLKLPSLSSSQSQCYSSIYQQKKTNELFQIKEQYKHLLKERKLEAIYQEFTKLTLSRSAVKEIAYFLGLELYELACRCSALEAKELLFHAEKYLSECTGAEEHQLLAKIYFTLGQFAFPKNNEEAITYFNLALKNLVSKKIYLPDMQWEGIPTPLLPEIVNPELSAQIHIALGKASLLDGNWQSAYRSFERAKEQDCRSVEALSFCGCLAGMEKGIPFASDFFQQALSLDRKEAAKNILDVIFYFFPQHFLRAKKREEIFLESPLYPREISHYREHIRNYNWFINLDSKEVTRNFAVCQRVFNEIHAHVENPQLRKALTAEILLKEIAFYSPEKGRGFFLPSSIIGEEMISYKVEKIFYLGEKIPVYCLVSPNASPIVLFRGTAPALSREGGVRSVIENADPEGVAQKLFRAFLPDFKAWLKDKTKEGQGAHILGYSQGATLAACAIVECHEYVSKDPNCFSITFNSPGVDTATFKKWETIPLAARPPIIQYLVEGDLVSRYGSGLIIGKAYEIATAIKHGMLNAHLAIVLVEHYWKMREVDIERDNQALFRQFATGVLEGEYGQALYSFLKNNNAINYLLILNEITSNSQVGQTFNYALKLKNLISKILKI